MKGGTGDTTTGGGGQGRAPVKPTIPPGVLDRVDVRVGTIERVEDVEGSNKLVRLVVSFGDHRRSILAGLRKERDDPAARHPARAGRA